MTRRTDARVIHTLKTWPKYFDATYRNIKNFEIRENDRDFQQGDILELREWDPEIKDYTGRRVTCEVVMMWNRLPGLDSCYVAMTIVALMKAENLFDGD